MSQGRLVADIGGPGGDAVGEARIGGAAREDRDGDALFVEIEGCHAAQPSGTADEQGVFGGHGWRGERGRSVRHREAAASRREDMKLATPAASFSSGAQGAQTVSVRTKGPGVTSWMTRRSDFMTMVCQADAGTRQ